MLLSDQKHLEELAARAQEEKVIALDTEFVWTDTYYPRLGVVQAGFAGGDCFLIDIPAVRECQAFAESLTDKSIVKILHDAPQDLRIIAQWCGAKAVNIFDSRTACGFIGLPSTISLAAMHLEILDIELPKTESRTDWLRRPLTDRQVEYAKDDVRYLPEIRRILLEKITELGRLGWLKEEMSVLDCEELYAERTNDEVFRKIKGGNRLKPQNLAILRRLAAWREELARKINLTKNRIANDKELLSISEAKPTNFKTLFDLGLRAKNARNYGEDILKNVEEALNEDEAFWPAPRIREPDSKSVKARINAAYDFLCQKCEEARIDPALVSSKSDVADIVRFFGQETVSKKAILDGWRLDFVGNELLTFIADQITQE